MYIYIYDLLHSATELWRHRAEQRVREREGEIQNEERTRKQTNKQTNKQTRGKVVYVIYIYILPCSSHSEKKIPRSTCVCVCVRDSIVGRRERERKTYSYINI